MFLSYFIVMFRRAKLRVVLMMKRKLKLEVTQLAWKPDNLRMKFEDGIRFNVK